MWIYFLAILMLLLLVVDRSSWRIFERAPRMARIERMNHQIRIVDLYALHCSHIQFYGNKNFVDISFNKIFRSIKQSALKTENK